MMQMLQFTKSVKNFINYDGSGCDEQIEIWVICLKKQEKKIDWKGFFSKKKIGNRT